MKQIPITNNLKILEDFVQKIPIRLACTIDSEWPAIISLWYTCMDGKIICATQENSKIVSFLRQNPKCAFEIAGDVPPYRGFRGKGIATIRKDGADNVLEILIKKYISKENSELENFLRKNIHNEVLIEINPVKLITWDYSKRMKNSI